MVFKWSRPKTSGSWGFSVEGVQGYLNEVGRKPALTSLAHANWFKGYLNEVGRKLTKLINDGLKGI